MEIAAFQQESFIDYPGKISTIIFTARCNFKCPGCHAKNIIATKNRVLEKEFFKYLNSKKDWIEGVVICGGEPTVEPDLMDFIKKIKEKGFLVKLDTNGSNPEKLSELLKNNLVDYVAMDVKAPKALYGKVTGTKDLNHIDSIEKSMKIVSKFPNYEFRTTIFPVIRKDGEISFLTPKEIESLATWLVEITGNKEHKYFLQAFVPRVGELMDERLEEFPETPEDLLNDMHEKVVKHLPNAKIR